MVFNAHFKKKIFLSFFLDIGRKMPIMIQQFQKMKILPLHKGRAVETIFSPGMEIYDFIYIMIN